MSLRTIGYLDGKAIRVDEGPSSVSTSRSLFRVADPIALREPTPRDTTDRTRIDQPGPPTPCELTARCRHRPCVLLRVTEARRLSTTTNLTLSAIGKLMGGRDHSTVSYWIREYQDKDAA